MEHISKKHNQNYLFYFQELKNNPKLAPQIEYLSLFAMLNQSDKFYTEGLTYDDVLVLPAYSEILPREVNTTTQLSRNIQIKIPIVTAAMDTVTESRLAIAISQEGGIGIMHKNMSTSAKLPKYVK